MKIDIESIFAAAGAEDLEGFFDGVGARPPFGAARRIRQKVTGRGFSPRLLGRYAAAAASFVIIAAGVAAWGGLFTPDNAVTDTDVRLENDSTATKTVDPGSNYAEPLPNVIWENESFDRIVWSDSEDDAPYADIDPSNTVKWNGLNVTKRLNDALESSDDGDVFAITVKTMFPSLEYEDFVYHGSTGADYQNDLDYVSQKLYYIEMLFVCAGGTQTEEYEMANFGDWIVPGVDGYFGECGKNEIIEALGEEFLGNYFKNGEFDFERIKADKESISKECAEAREIYYESSHAFIHVKHASLFWMLQSDKVYSGYDHERDFSYNLAVVTKSELAALHEKHVSHEGFNIDNFCFSLTTYSPDDYEKTMKSPSDIELEMALNEILLEKLKKAQ